MTINLNHYVWSNGEAVTAQDVAFWLNMYKTDPERLRRLRARALIPDDIASLVVKSPTQLVITLKSSVNSFWYTLQRAVADLPDADGMGRHLVDGSQGLP